MVDLASTAAAVTYLFGWLVGDLLLGWRSGEWPSPALQRSSTPIGGGRLTSNIGANGSNQHFTAQFRKAYAASLFETDHVSLETESLPIASDSGAGRKCFTVNWQVAQDLVLGDTRRDGVRSTPHEIS